MIQQYWIWQSMFVFGNSSFAGSGIRPAIQFYSTGFAGAQNVPMSAPDSIAVCDME